LGNDQYPKTLSAAIDVLSNHKLDPAYYENQKKKQKRENQHRQSQHRSRESTNNQPQATSFAQRTVVCYYYGKKGHTSMHCELAGKTPKKDWHVNKAIQHMQNNDDDASRSDDDDRSTRSDNSTSSQNCRSGTSKQDRGRRSTTRDSDGWFKGFQTQTNTNPVMEATAWLQGLQLDPKSPLFSRLINKHWNNGKFLDDLKYLFIYDTGSNVIPATISNPDFAMKIGVAKRPKTISTSTGRGTFNLEAFVKGLGWCPY
jgi:hypothetical protein